MTRFWLIVIAAVSWSLGTTCAEVIEVELPALRGVYAEDGTVTRTATFRLDPPPVVVHGAWIRLSGDATGGTTECDGGGTNPWPFDFTSMMRDSTTGGFWLAGGWTSGETEAFDITDGFSPLFGAGWGFLDDGSGQVELSGAQALSATAGVLFQRPPEP